MNKETAIETLQMLQQSHDTEMAHIDADDILCQLLETLGYEDVVSEYQKVNKWFA
mgnify:FL=1